MRTQPPASLMPAWSDQQECRHSSPAAGAEPISRTGVQLLGALGIGSAAVNKRQHSTKYRAACRLATHIPQDLHGRWVRTPARLSGTLRAPRLAISEAASRRGSTPARYAFHRFDQTRIAIDRSGGRCHRPRQHRPTSTVHASFSPIVASERATCGRLTLCLMASPRRRRRQSADRHGTRLACCGKTTACAFSVVRPTHSCTSTSSATRRFALSHGALSSCRRFQNQLRCAQARCRGSPYQGRFNTAGI